MQIKKINHGFTLLELMIVMAIVAIGVALAVPTFQNTMQKRQLTRGAEEIAAFLSLAQGEAVKRNKVVAISIEREDDGRTWCVGSKIKTAASPDHCDCYCENNNRDDDDLCENKDPDDDDYCDFNPDGAGTLQLVNQDGFKNFTMNDSSSSIEGDANNDFHFNFDPVRGTKVDDSGVTDSDVNDITLLSENENYSLKVDVSVTGRIRVCNPEDNMKVPGFKDC